MQTGLVPVLLPEDVAAEPERGDDTQDDLQRVVITSHDPAVDSKLGASMRQSLPLVS